MTWQHMFVRFHQNGSQYPGYEWQRRPGTWQGIYLWGAPHSAPPASAQRNRDRGLDLFIERPWIAGRHINFRAPSQHPFQLSRPAAVELHRRQPWQDRVQEKYSAITLFTIGKWIKVG